MKTKKLTKRQIKQVGVLFPEKTDIVKGNFSYYQYIQDVNAFRQGKLQGYFADYEDIDLNILFGNVPYEETHDPEFAELVKRTGDLDNPTYDREIALLHKEFKDRIFAGEDIETVDIDISAKMEELATRNLDGSHVVQPQAKQR